MPKTTFFIALLSFCFLNTFSQCPEWSTPTPEVGYDVFNSVPCNGDTLSITAFEIWQSDAYEIENLQAGATYEFNHCEGSGAWTPEYTVFAPSGEIEAFGPGTGCSFSWTAAETGTYTIAVNEADSCGIAGTTNNGFPSLITISGGSDCPPPPVVIDGAESFELDSLPECWVIYDQDEDDSEWEIDSSGIAFDGDNLMRSYSFVPGFGALSPDNYLVSPPLNISEGDSLYYVVAALSDFFPNEFYSIEVAMNGNQPEDFIEIFSETLNSTDWEGRSLDMSDYAGEIVYIAFRHQNSFDQSALLIDAVALPGEVLPNCENVLSTDDLLPGDFKLYPNPTNGQLSITSFDFHGVTSIQIFDLAGKLVESTMVQLTSNGANQLDLNHLDRGVYLLRIIGTEKVGSRKLIIR